MSENKSLSEIINFRIEKLNKIKESKVKSFPYNFKYSCKIIELILGFGEKQLLEIKNLLSIFNL